MDWDRTPTSQGEIDLCKLCSEAALSHLRTMSDGDGNPLSARVEDAAKLLDIHSPIILNALDDLDADEPTLAVEEEFPPIHLSDPNFVWSDAIFAFHSLASVDAIALGPIENNGLSLSFTEGELIRSNLPASGELDLDHSRAFNMHRWSDHDDVNRLVADICGEFFEGRTQTLNTIKRQLHPLLLDLFLAWHTDPELKIGMARNENIVRVGSRYNELEISAKMIGVVDQLRRPSVGLLHFKQGFYNAARPEQSRTSRVWPTKKLISKFQACLFTTLDITDHPDRECIILRSEADDRGQKKDVEYNDTDLTYEMRSALQRYNSLLKRTYIDIPTMERSYFDVRNGEVIDNEDIDDLHDFSRRFIAQDNKFVRRIFNRESFTSGGRFYGGWWQNCPEAVRGKIFMDDWPVSEIDFTGLHFVMLYAQAGINYWDEIREDPYTIERPEFVEPSANFRAMCKRLAFIAVNAETEQKAIRGFRGRALANSPERHYTDNQIKQLLDNLREKHAAIGDKFASDAGIDLMYADSQISESIIKKFLVQDIPVLCMHDSYLVPCGLEEELRQSMQQAFADVTGVTDVRLDEETVNPNTITFSPVFNPQSDYSHDEWLEFIRRRLSPPRTDRYLDGWNRCRELWEKSDRPHWAERVNIQGL